MAVAEAAIGELTRSVSRSSSNSEKLFRQAAADNNRNVTKIAKDLGGAIVSQKKDINNLASSISDSADSAAATSQKLDNLNSLTQESVALHGSVVAELKNVKAGLSRISDLLNNGLLGLGNIFGVANIFSKGKISPTTAALGGAAVGGGAVAGASYLMGGGQGGAISPQATFASLNEEQKSTFLQRQAKAEGVRPSLNNPGAMQASDPIARKYGATAGPNNGTITLAQFPSPEAGQQAHRERWESQSYRDLPLGQAVNRYVQGDVNREPAPYYKQTIFGADPHQRDATRTDGQSPTGQQGGMVTLQTSKNKIPYTVDARYAQNFKGFVDELESLGYEVRSMSSHRPGSVVAGTGRPSFHSAGMAIDINPEKNPHIQGEAGRNFDPNKTEFKDREQITALANKYGLGWGGNWQSSKDYMHFSAGGSEGAAVAGNMDNNRSVGQAPQQQAQMPPTMMASPFMPSNSIYDSMAMGALVGGPKGMAIGGLIGAFAPLLTSAIGNMVSREPPVGQMYPSVSGSQPDERAPQFVPTGNNNDNVRRISENATEETAMRQRALEEPDRTRSINTAEESNAEYWSRQPQISSNYNNNNDRGETSWLSRLFGYYPNDLDKIRTS